MLSKETISKVINKPARFIHDCSVCNYKGRIDEYDIYTCNNGESLIARYGDQGWEYLSKSIDEL